MALVMLVTCVSCRQDLCYDHYPSMDVNLTWEQEWERDYGHNHRATWDAALHQYEYDELRPGMPEWVLMTRYFKDGHTTERFLSPDGSRFEVEIGEESSMLLYNGDTEYIILSDVASLNDVRASATTRTRASSALQLIQEKYQHSRTTNPPDVIYSAYIDHVDAMDHHDKKLIPVKMQPLVYTYLITFEFEKGLDAVSLARGALGGMAEGVYLKTGVTTDETSIILFDCDIKSGACRSVVRSFGIPGFPDSYFGRSASEAKGPFSVNLELRLKNGKTVDYNFDITDQVKHQPRGGVIRVKGIKIDDELIKPNLTGAGFYIDVTGWDDKEEEITLPPDDFTTT